MDPFAAALAAGTRDVPIQNPPTAAVLVVDMQNAFCHVESAIWDKVQRTPYIEDALAQSTSCMERILCAARATGVEVLYTVVEALTHDGRERSLDYKLSAIHVPRGTWGARVIEQLAPAQDDIVLRKGSSSVFVSTNIAYLLRNLGVKQLIVVGGLTDQCIDSAVRDACDEGFLVTVPTDACYTHTADRHANALANNRGYCRQIDTDTVVREFAALEQQPTKIRQSNGNYGKPIASSVTTTPLRTLTPTPQGTSEYIRYEVFDYNGRSQSKLVPVRHREKDVFMYSGSTAAGANSQVLMFPPEIVAAGFYNSKLHPFWDTYVHLPWAGVSAGAESKVKIHRVICEQQLADGSRPHVPRAVVRGLLEELHEQHGLMLLSASEFEFCVATKDCKPLFDGPEIFVTLQNTKTAPYQYAVERAMRAVGIDVKTSNAEYGAGQLEITYAPKFGVQAPDAAVTFRTGVKEIAQQHGFLATFCSSPFALRGCGNGGHLNFSLWRAATDAGEPLSAMGAGELSSEARHFLAGILRHAPAMEAFCAPTPCCYARHGNWAPDKADWGVDDRTRHVRVKLADEAEHQYFELRAPSASSNPYLATAALLAAGMLGLENEYELPSPQQPDAQVIPASLEDALEALEKDTLFVKRVGETMVRWFAQVKRGELAMLKKWQDELMEKDALKTHDDAKLLAYQRMYIEYI